MIKKKMISKFILMFFTVLFINLSIKGVYAIEKAERISDREIIERLTKLETKLEEGQKAINQRFDDVKGDINNVRTDINNLRNFMTWGFGVLFSGFCVLMGFVLWDRRTALAPAVKKSKELEEREEELERWKKKTDMALKELAGKDVKVAEVLRHVGLL